MKEIIYAGIVSQHIHDVCMWSKRHDKFYWFYIDIRYELEWMTHETNI